MKKKNKKGFTLVEIMIVVAIIGLLAAIGIPSILNAFQHGQESAMDRNIAEVNKAKAQLTLPPDVAGGVGALQTDSMDTVREGTNLTTHLYNLLNIESLDDLDVGDRSISIGSTIGDRATYPTD